MTWIVRHPWLSSLLALAMVIALAPGLSKLQIDSSSDGILSQGDQDLAFYQEAKEIFGDDTTLTIMLKTDDIFTQAILESIMRLSEEGKQLKGVSRVISLATVGNLKGRDGILNTDPLLSYVPQEQEAIDLIREDALSNDNLIGEVINAEGTTTAVHYNIESHPEDKGFEARLVATVDKLIQDELERLGSGVDIYQLGPPNIKAKIIEYIERDWKVVGLASIGVMLLVLLLFFRSLIAVFIPCLTGSLSVVATLGFMGHCGFTVNPVTIIIPMLLLAVGCTEDIHLIAEYARGLRSGQKKHEAIYNMAIKSGTAIFLTSLTTLVGFLTLAPNSIPMVSEFGISASFGMLVNFILTILIVPTLFTWTPAPENFKKSEQESLYRLKRFVLSTTTHHYKIITITVVFVIGIAVFGCFKVVVSTNYLYFFKENSEIRETYRKASKDFSVGTNFYVVIDTGRESGANDPETLQQIEQLTDYIAEKYDKAIGYPSLIRKLRMEVNDGNPEYRSIPDSEDEIAQYALMINPDDLARFVDFDLRKTCILVRREVSGSQATNAMVKDIENWIQNNISPTLDIRLSGETLLIAKSAEIISREIIINLLYVFIAISIVLAILFGSLRAGLLAMIPNMIPILINFGFMGIFNIPLSTATFPVAMIALGIAVDDTIHLIVRYTKERKDSTHNLEAIKSAISQEIRPVTTTSVALIAGFLILLLGEFGSVQQFGILSAVAISSALLCDLFVTPLLLRFTPHVSQMRLPTDKER
jgi:predicted RND superfamily exporter protein